MKLECFFKATWSDRLCKNIISQVGFGKGSLKVSGGKGLRQKFALPHLGNNEQEIYVFPGVGIRTKLTFGWFMVTLVCGEKPWLCAAIRDEKEGRSFLRDEATGSTE